MEDPVGLTELPDPKQSRGAPKVPALGATWTLQSPGPQKDPWSPQISASGCPVDPTETQGPLNRPSKPPISGYHVDPTESCGSPKAPALRCPMHPTEPLTLVRPTDPPGSPCSAVSNGTHSPTTTAGSPVGHTEP